MGSEKQKGSTDFINLVPNTCVPQTLLSRFYIQIFSDLAEDAGHKVSQVKFLGNEKQSLL